MPMTQGELFDRLWDLDRRGSVPVLGVVGGTFDPIHVGHTAMALAARDELALDALLFVPAGNPNFKQGRGIVSSAHRLDMVALAVRDVPNCAVSTLETERPGITYTYDTLCDLRGMLPPSARLVFVMGADSLQSFPLWYRASDLARLAEYAVAAREGSGDPAGMLCTLRHAGLDPVVHVLASRVPTVSSTQLRGLLEAGASTRGLLDPAVARYIAEHGLYRA